MATGRLAPNHPILPTFPMRYFRPAAGAGWIVSAINSPSPIIPPIKPG